MKESALLPVLETIGEPYSQREIVDYRSSVLIRHSIFRLRTEQNKLNQTISGLKEKDHALLEKAISACKKNDKRTANRHTTKLVENRKILNFLSKVSLGIERFVLRLEAKLEIGDVDVTRSPKLASLALHSMCKELSKILPDVSNEIENVCDVVEGKLFV